MESYSLRSTDHCAILPNLSDKETLGWSTLSSEELSESEELEEDSELDSGGGGGDFGLRASTFFLRSFAGGGDFLLGTFLTFSSFGRTTFLVATFFLGGGVGGEGGECALGLPCLGEQTLHDSSEHELTVSELEKDSERRDDERLCVGVRGRPRDLSRDPLLLGGEGGDLQDTDYNMISGEGVNGRHAYYFKK